MRNWEIPALLTTVAFGGLTSLFAQGPAAPTLVDPTPVADVAADPLPAPPSPAPVVISNSPMPTNANPAPVLSPEPGPIYSAPPAEHVIESTAAPSTACHGCAVAAPVEQAAPATTCHTCGVQPPAPVYAAPQPVTPSCGCQAGQPFGANNGYNSYGGQGYYTQNAGVSGVFGVYGSGSGVGSGLLSPVANSGGLHARYPYYNYRHSWYYQGPASQNVTIVW